MEVIIDGYNLLKNIYPKVEQLKKQRNQLIRQLGYYLDKRAGIRKIIVVFDGGVFPHAQREVHDGVVVIFAGYKSNADRWIIGYVERNKHHEILVVSNDREVVRAARNLEADAISVRDFYDRLQDALLDQEVLGKPEHLVELKKYDEETVFQDESLFDHVDQAGLDLLMEQAGLSSVDKMEEDEVKERRAGGGRNVSKKEKRRLAKIKKL